MLQPNSVLKAFDVECERQTTVIILKALISTKNDVKSTRVPKDFKTDDKRRKSHNFVVDLPENSTEYWETFRSLIPQYLHQMSL